MQILDPGKIVTLYKTFDQLTEEDQNILRSLALEMISFSESYLIYHKKIFSGSRLKCSSWLQKIEQTGILYRSHEDYGDYRITPIFHVFILLEIAKNPDKESLAYLKENYDEEEDAEEFLPLFFSYIQKKSDWHFEDTSEYIIEDLLPCFIYFEELTSVFQQFPVKLKIDIWNEYYEHQLSMLRPVNQDWHTRYMAEISDSTQVMVAKLYDSAFQMQLNSEYEQAILTYEQALKIENQSASQKKIAFPNNILYCFGYAAALLQVTNPRNSKKIQTLLKKKDLKENNRFFATYLLLSAGTESVFTRDINRTAVYRLTTPLSALLYSWVCKNYELPLVEHELIDEAFVLVKADYFSLLRSLTASYYPEILYGTSGSRSDMPPLLPSYRKLKPWEAVLDKLLKDPAIVPKTEKTVSETATTRIIYLLTRNMEVIPVLQRSKDGEIWKGGRKISIKTFSEGLPEMNETDRMVANTARRYRAQWGSAYEYILGGENTLAALTGYPLVFLYRNPDIPVEIVKQHPYISVTRLGEKFRIQTNVINPDNNSLIQVNQDNDTRITVLQLTATQSHIIQQLTRIPEYPVESEPMLKELLSRISGTLSIHSDLVDTEEKLNQKQGDTTPVVQLLPLGEQYKAELFVKPLGDYPPYCKPGVGNRSVMGMINGNPVQAIRNFRTETAMRRPVDEIFSEFDPDATDILTLESTVDCLELLEQLHQQGDSVKIEWPEGERMKIRSRASSSGFSIIAKKNNTWFEIDGALRISKNEEIGLTELMKQVTISQTRFIRLEGDEYLALTHDLRRQLIELNSLLSHQKGKLCISELAAPLLDIFEKGGVEVKTDAHYDALIKRIHSASQQSHKMPVNLQANLREYQEEGYLWMQRLSDWGAGACLADDMGLGKTVQAIAVLLAKAAKGASLVVAPASVLTNWENEIHRFAPTLNVYNLNASNANREQMITEAGEADIVITTYGLLISEADKLQKKNWNIIVLDEAHTIKNRETKMSKAAMRLTGDFRMILTGTPLQNHLSEIWNLFEFINPGLLGSFQSFTERFIMPIELRQDKQQQRLLKRILSPFILRRTKNEVLSELPGKTEILLPVELSKEEITLYETMRRKAEMSLKNKDLNAVKTLAEITRLRQAACHPAMVKPDYEGKCSKTAVFMELIWELRENNHRALVFSQFTSHLKLIREELERNQIEYLYLDGSTPAMQRSKLVKEFQTGSQPVFLISLKAGGLGLNLTAADYIIHLDPWWNPAIEDQASDRAYRIGQTRPVTVYRLIARHTIEEKIIELHHTKKDLADSLLEGSNIAHKLTREEMLALLQKG
ncbi:MAG: DEAD/DEAH box helicase [Bacteroidales bacterium]